MSWPVRFCKKKNPKHIFSGLAQCAELVKQLRGLADKRQVDGAKIAMQHNFGIGGAAVVTMYKKYQPLPVHAKLWGEINIAPCLAIIMRTCILRRVTSFYSDVTDSS